jgi:hypothetical protein
MIPAKIFGYNIEERLSLNDIDYSRSSIFLDGSVVVPTVCGLPLNLAVNGTSAVQLKSKTNFDVGNMLTTGDALLSQDLSNSNCSGFGPNVVRNCKWAS